MAGFLQSWDDPVNPIRNELVFANRNKEYGAFMIRRLYNKRVVMALVYALAVVVLAVGVPALVNLLSESEFLKKNVMSEEITLAEPPPIDKTQPPPPPVIPPPPVQQTIKFTPPKVVKDEEVPDEPPPTQEEMKDVQISTVTQEGSKDIVDLPPETEVAEEQIFTFVEEMPSFPGGETKLFEYLKKNINYPAIARENGIQGRVYVTFVVDKDGKIKNAKILRGGLGGGLEEEALRVVRAMPDWKAGKQNGRAVQVQYNLPIYFTLN